MNYGELKTQIAKWAHRTDLGEQIPQLVANTTKRLNRRFGLSLGPLVADTDTNIILDNNEDIYLYGGLQEQAAYVHNAGAVQEYKRLYQAEIRQLNINYAGTEWDTTPLVMGDTCEDT